MPERSVGSPGRLGTLLDERFGVSALRYDIPSHGNRLPYTLGGITAGTFLLLVATGIYLAQFYDPQPEEAHASVAYIIAEAPAGRLVRSLHFWLADIFVVALILHLLRTGAHGGEELAEQPAKVLVQQALALLQAGKDPGEAAERLDAADQSEDKSKVNPELLEQGHEALESGDVEGAIELLRQSLAEPEPKEAEEAEAAPEEKSEPAPPPPSAPLPQPEPAPPAPAPSETPEPESAEEELVAPIEEELGDADAIHEAAETFRPDQSGQELAAAIGGGLLFAGVIGGLAWRFRRDARAGDSKPE